MRILMVLIPDEDGTQTQAALQIERVAVPYYMFLDAGLEVVFASPEGGSPRIEAGSAPSLSTPARRFLLDSQARDAATDTLALDEVHSGDFEAALCVGAAGPIWTQDTDPAAAMIGRFLDSGKPVAVIPSHIDIEPLGSHLGLLILGEGNQSPAQTAKALLGVLQGKDLVLQG